MRKYWVFLSVLFCACTSLEKVTSDWESEVDINSYSYYNSESKIRYDISNSADTLHIRLNTSDQASILKIMRGGLKIYLDTDGKKNKRQFIQYPLGHDGVEVNREEIATASRHGKKKDMNQMLMSMGTALIYENDGRQKHFSINDNSPIVVKVYSQKEGSINYDVKVPFNLITPAQEDHLKNIAIGITSEALDINEKTTASFQQMSRGKGGMGSRGGGMGRGSRGGGMGGAHPNPQMSQSLGKAIDIWFKVELDG